jgi:hypothetical protein
MSNTPTNDAWFQNRATEQIHLEQLKRAERFNGRAAMLGIVIGIVTEAITGSGIAHQIGLGPSASDLDRPPQAAGSDSEENIGARASRQRPRHA